MSMEFIEGRFIFKDVTQSKTLDHYEKYGHSEIHRVPMHLDSIAAMNHMLANDQIASLVKISAPMLRVNVGCYISILCHLDSLPKVDNSNLHKK